MKPSALSGLFLFLLLSCGSTMTFSQVCCEPGKSTQYQVPATAYDTILASRIRALQLPEEYRTKSLPSAVDNSVSIYFPGIYAQYLFFSCQQYSSITYLFTYEMNRLRNVSANHAETRYPAHYTWNFMNFGGQFIGVNFLQSFRALMQQGQMNRADYGYDTAMRYVGWISGYDKYERAFPNRVLEVNSIPVTTEDGILTLKHFLNDHLDGSATGGMACFTAAGPTNIVVIPEGSPEAGKHIVVTWQPWATHGMTIVGYNDTIRYDINGDGQFTNNIDITGDGKTDVRDWEIGAFKFANSYGTWWADAGYGYALYSSFAHEFEEGGVWNNCVYVAQPDTAYHPLLGMQFNLKDNQRNTLKITAGVNTDLSADYPAHTMEFPYFNNQGGPHVMQGFDSIAGQDEIELGLDVTPLLSYTKPGEPARYFFIVEEDDPYHLGTGTVQKVIFHDYTGSGEVFISPDTDVPIPDQGTVLLSAVGATDFSPVEISTESLPAIVPGQAYSTRLAARGGVEPYRWTLLEDYLKSPATPGYTGVTDLRLWEISDEIAYAPVVLPFSFPFFGKNYDTVYMNNRGMLQFTPDHLPYPYLANWNDMLRNLPLIFPAFSSKFSNIYADGDGMWVRIEPDKVTFRWKLSISEYESTSDNSFEVVLYPGGSFEFHFGACTNTTYAPKVITGYSRGDDTNFELTQTNDLSTLSGLSFHYDPPVCPAGISLSEDGLLTLDDPDSTHIFQVKVKVTDERLLTDTKVFRLTSGLQIVPSMHDTSDMAFFGEPQQVDLEISNTGQTALSDLTLTYSCNDTLVTVTDSSEVINTLNPGQTVTISGPFTFELLSPVPDQSLLWFTIDATGSGHHWQYTFPVTVSAPDIQLREARIHDGMNELLDPGEVADWEIQIGNLGSRSADSVTVSVVLSDTLIEIISPESLFFSTLPPDNALNTSFRLHADRTVPAGSTQQVILRVTTASGPEYDFPFDLQIGSKPIAILNLTDNTTSVTAMETALDSIGAPYNHYTWVGNQLLPHRVIFLILGTTSGSHSLSDNEDSFFSSYLESGGKMYMESYSEWYYNKTQLKSMFYTSAEKTGLYDFTRMSGLNNTLCDGLTFQYLNSSNYAIFDMLPVSPGFAIADNGSSDPHVMQIAYHGDDYQTIGSMIEFGKLADSVYPSTKTGLMERYLDFFGVVFNNPYPFFHADSTTICRFHSVQFADDSYDNIVSWQWEFPGGQPSSSTLQNPMVEYPVKGEYDVKLTVSDGTKSHSITRKKFIRVVTCAGEDEPSLLSEVLVFPNPAKDVIRISLPDGINNPVRATLYDITGKVIRRVVLPDLLQGETATISTDGIRNGFYILNFSVPGETVCRKVFIDR